MFNPRYHEAALIVGSHTYTVKVLFDSGGIGKLHILPGPVRLPYTLTAEPEALSDHHDTGKATGPWSGEVDRSRAHPPYRRFT